MSPAAPAICVLGGRGRFGSRILAVLRESGIRAYPSGAEAVPGPTAIVDASAPSALDTLIASARRSRAGVVYCVSAMPAESRERLRALARSVPVIIVANASVGSHLQLALARFLAESPLLDDYDVAYTVVDRHPVTKKDAPSATAKRIAEIVGPDRGTVSVSSERHGEPVADHAFVLRFGSESLRVEHSVSSLDSSARQVARLALLIPALAAGCYPVSEIYEQFGRSLPKLPLAG